MVNMQNVICKFLIELCLENSWLEQNRIFEKKLKIFFWKTAAIRKYVEDILYLAL